MKEYKFYGINFKTGLKIGFLLYFFLLSLFLFMLIISALVPFLRGNRIFKIDIAISLLFEGLFLLWIANQSKNIVENYL